MPSHQHITHHGIGEVYAIGYLCAADYHSIGGARIGDSRVFDMRNASTWIIRGSFFAAPFSYDIMARGTGNKRSTTQKRSCNSGLQSNSTIVEEWNDIKPIGWHANRNIEHSCLIY